MNNEINRTEQLKDYLRRLNSGEDPESVRADFVRNFNEVKASEIMNAEQEMLNEGTPLSEVQKLCDIHSALFHGATKEERIANAEKAVKESVKKQTAEAIEKHRAMMAANKTDYSKKNEVAAVLEAIPGHPLQTMTKENKALETLIEQIYTAISAEKDMTEFLPKLCDLSVHYAKKGDLLYPLLKVKYDISGPSDVMWTVDDEIRDELSALLKDTDHNDKWYERFGAVMKRAKEMIFKEQNILFPICAVNFTEEEWAGIYRDAKDYGVCFGVDREVWESGEKTKTRNTVQTDNEIIMSGGHLTLKQLTALLNTIPMEITFVDAENINRYFNEGEKVFKRPGMAIDREVFSCHPPKIEPMVRSIISDFRSGKRDSVPVWMEKGGRVMLVKYMAVRDEKGNYLGTVELVQDMEFAREYFTKKGK